MKNYTYRREIKRQGYVEMPEEEYTERMWDMKKFVDQLSDIVKEAKCGWDGVWYKVMKNEYEGNEKYMVLHVNGGGERWIPINGNSKGCNLAVLGENLW